MLSLRSQFVLGLIVLALLCVPAAGWAQDSQVPGQRATPSATPALPADLAQVPSGKSDVTYVNGQLTIRAHKAPLIEVVRTVCNRIGAELDAKYEPRESVVGIMGPGPAKEVLASLLNDSHLNYAMGGTPDDPNVLTSVIIFSEGKASSEPKQVAEQQAVHNAPISPQESSKPLINVREVVSETTELLDATRAELANGGLALDSQGGSAGGQNIDMGYLLQQIDAQIKAVTADPNSSQSLQQTDPGPAGPAPVLPTGRPRHRKHH
jgi:hypothetical protein